MNHTGYYDDTGPGTPGSVLTIGFNLNGNALTALNGGPAFTFNKAISLVVHCDDQQEIDYYWEKLLDGGSSKACGWPKDRYGVAWQIVPSHIFELISSGDLGQHGYFTRGPG